MKEIFENKRYRSLIILLVCLFFFSFVILDTKSKIKKDLVTKDDIKEEIDKEINKPQQIIDIELNKVLINDMEYDLNKNILYYNNKEYTEIPYKLKKYNFENYKNINNLNEYLILESKNYIDNYETYIVKISDYEKVINDKNIKDNKSIKIKIYNDKIIIDLEEYLGYVVELRGN